MQRSLLLGYLPILACGRWSDHIPEPRRYSAIACYVTCLEGAHICYSLTSPWDWLVGLNCRPTLSHTHAHFSNSTTCFTRFPGEHVVRPADAFNSTALHTCLIVPQKLCPRFGVRAGKMAGKLTLHKLVVLGDGGVGKTALTIQVRRDCSDIGYEDCH